MSESLRQTIELVSHIPTEAEHPIYGLSVMAIAGALALKDRAKFSHTEEARYTQISNAAQLEASVQQDRQERRRKGLTPGHTGLMGLGLVAASLISAPKYTSSHETSNESVAVVQSFTRSMTGTYDLGSPTVSREQAVIDGLEGSSFSGRLELIQPATAPTISEPLTFNWKNKYAFTAQKVDGGDGTISSAIETAAADLPTNKSGKHSGNVIVVSDGIITDTPAQLSHALQTVQREGVGIKFIVPGTSTGTYKFTAYSQPTPSAEQSQNFDIFGSGNVQQPQTVNTVKADIKDALSTANSEHIKKDSYLITALGGLLTALSISRFRKRTNERYI